jgi:hypothetical protein
MTQDVTTEVAADEGQIKAVITTLLASYPKRVAEEASQQYIASLRGACYGSPVSILMAMLDPITGVVGKCPFIPTAAEIRKFIEGKEIERDRLVRLSRMNLRLEKSYELTPEERAARIAKLREVRGKLVQHSDADRAERMANMFSRHRA